MARLLGRKLLSKKEIDNMAGLTPIRGRFVSVRPYRVKLEDGRELEPERIEGNHRVIGWNGTLIDGTFFPDK